MKPADDTESPLDDLDWSGAASFREASGKQAELAEPLPLASLVAGQEEDSATFR